MAGAELPDPHLAACPSSPPPPPVGPAPPPPRSATLPWHHSMLDVDACAELAGATLGLATDDHGRSALTFRYSGIRNRRCCASIFHDDGDLPRRLPAAAFLPPLLPLEQELSDAGVLWDEWNSGDDDDLANADHHRRRRVTAPAAAEQAQLELALRRRRRRGGPPLGEEVGGVHVDEGPGAAERMAEVRVDEALERMAEVHCDGKSHTCVLQT